METNDITYISEYKILSQERTLSVGKTMAEEIEDPGKVKTPCALYNRVRLLAILSKLVGVFPVMNVTAKDGRQLKHCWLNWIYFYDLIIGCVFLYWYISTCHLLLQRGIANGTEADAFIVWITLTCYVVVVRGITQFILVHIYAPTYPTFFYALEDYNYGIGRNSVKCSVTTTRDLVFSIIWTICLLLIIQSTAYLFFRQFELYLSWLEMIPVSISYTLANVWKDLPMNMFVKLCINLTRRITEIRDDLRQLKLMNGKELGKELEALRLQHAALVRLVSLLESCFGMQFMANIGFMIVDMVLQLFVFFVLTFSTNVFLLLLTFYYVIACVIMLVIVEHLQRTDAKLLEEIASFEVYTAPQSQQIQIQLFTAQITAKPTRISAAGFFYINNAALCAILTAVATYLVMLVQFSPYIENQITLPGTNESQQLLIPAI